MEIQIKAYAYTIDIITEIRYFCKCNNAVFGKFRIIFTCAISKTDCSLHHSFHALFKISGNEKFVRTTTLASLVKGEVLSPERIRATTGGIAFLPHPFRFSDTSVNNPSIVGSASHCNRSSLYTRELKVIVLYQPSQNRTIPRPAPPPLPPLSKVRCCRPKKFGRLPEGLPHHYPLACANPSKTALSLSLFVGE